VGEWSEMAPSSERMLEEGASPEGQEYVSAAFGDGAWLGASRSGASVCLLFYFFPLLCLFFYRKDYSNEYSVLFI